MKKSIIRCALTVYSSLAILCGPICFGYGYGYGQPNGNYVNNDVRNDLAQNTNVVGGGSANSNSYSLSAGGSASAKSGDTSSGAYINYAPSSTANYKTRVPPLGFVPPYLPMWQHGGWGTVQGYFPNGPTTDDRAYEQTFDPSSKEDIRMLKRLLRSAPYEDGFKAFGGLFTSSLKTHRLRGFSVANAVVRDRRPDEKPFMLMIDNEIDRDLLKKAGYSYVGKVSVEAKESRNWDQCYGAVIAEVLPWDVDIVLLSGGMKGVTVGHNVSFGAGGGYSQTNYSLSLFGSKSSGVTEGKGKPLLSGECYRYSPHMNYRRNQPRDFYAMLQARYAQNNIQVPQPRGTDPATPVITARSGLNPANGAHPQPRTANGVRVNQQLMEMAGVRPQPVVDYVAAQPVNVNP